MSFLIHSLLTNPAQLCGLGKKVFLFILVTILTCSYSILVQLSKVNGMYEYSPMTVTFLAEFFKMMMSLSLYFYSLKQSPQELIKLSCNVPVMRMHFTWNGLLLYMIPGLIYLINNNLAFVAISLLTPSVYQLLANMKIFATAILFRVVIRQPLSNHQWAAVILLVLGCSVPELNAFHVMMTATSSVSSPSSSIDDDSVVTVINENERLVKGFLLMIVVSFLSGTTGVYTEYMFKRNKQSMHLKNTQLYLCGVILTGLALIFLSSSPLQQGVAFFKGYTPITWVVIINLALNGMAISFIMTYANNIIKLYAGAVAMFLSMLLSVILFEFSFDPHQMVGAMLVCISLYVYNIPESQIK